MAAIQVTDQGSSNQSRQAFTPAQAFDMAVKLHREGRLAEAAQVYRAILKLDPRHFGALHYLGMVATAQGAPQQAEQLIRQALALTDHAQARNNLGIALAAQQRHEEALGEYQRAIALDAENVEARNNLANTLQKLGRPDEAIMHLRQALTKAPERAELHNNLGNALAAAKHREEAVASLQKALELRPDFAEARNNLGFVLAALDRPEQAIVEYRRALALKPDYFEALDNLGNALAGLRRYDDAMACFEGALAIRPLSGETHNNLGNVLSALKRHDEAIPYYRKALELKPDFHEAHNNLGNTLAALDRLDEAVACFEKVLETHPDFADAHCGLANSLGRLNRHDEAVAHFGKALAIAPDMAEAHGGYGHELMSVGQLDEARRQLERAIELAPRRTEFHHSLSEMHRYDTGDPHLAVMEALAAEPDSLSEDQRIALYFALGKAYADFGEHDKAFRHLLQGNALKRRQVRYDEAELFARFERLKATFTPELFWQKQGLGDPSMRPIFILGMPRSGTTLVEQLLASHPMVFGAGELTHLSKALGRFEARDHAGKPFPENVPDMGSSELRSIAADYLAALPQAATPAQRITDKMPANYPLIGMIHLALPNARIIHTRRDPVDICLSCFSKLFVGNALPFTYDLAELGRHYRGYAALMEHWRRALPDGVMLEVQYEELVADFEPQARRILTYCGLEWDERCLAFHRTERPVRTASFVQVRQPLYDSSVGRWLPYKDVIQPLLAELDAVS